MRSLPSPTSWTIPPLNAKTLLLDEAPNVEVRDKDEFRKSQEKQIDILRVVINVLLGLSVGIALIGIANTLALSVHERTRELGLMRAPAKRAAKMNVLDAIAHN